jgi:hypothetical protein
MHHTTYTRVVHERGVPEPPRRLVPDESSLAETVELIARELDGVPPATRILS